MLESHYYTLVEHVAQGTVIQNHDLTEVWLYRAEILDERPMPKRTMLSIVTSREKLPFRFKPVDDWVGILLHRCREDNQVEPFANLCRLS